MAPVGAALVATSICVLGVLAPARAADDDLTVLFRKGVDAYQHGQIADAIRYWEALYAKAGPERGYRVAFNLARAYAIFGDTTQSAQEYEAFLAEVEVRRKRHATLDPTVEKEEGEARAELETLKAKNGRLHLLPAVPPVAVSLDGSPARVSGFTVYVTPGDHRLVFAPGTPAESARSVTLQAGQELDTAPPVTALPPATPPAPAPRSETPGASAATSAAAHHTAHPFSPVVLYVAAGVTAVSSLVPILTYVYASNLRNDALDVQGTRAYAGSASSYDSARAAAYGTLAVPLGLAAVTIGLGGWYFAGTHQVQDGPATSARILPFLVPGAPGQGGGTAGVIGTF
jgi:hypothetical protein